MLKAIWDLRASAARHVEDIRLAPWDVRFPSPPSPLYLFNAMVEMARCAVPARVVAGGTNIRVSLAFEEVAPLHAARTSQRDVPTTLTRIFHT